MVLSEINAAVALAERFYRLLPFKRKKPPESVSDRFVRIFESHGVHRTQIPRFFGRGVTLRAVENTELLTDVLTEEALQSACELFAINREWLDGRERQIHPVHDFYKDLKSCDEFLDALIEQQNGNDLGAPDAVLLAPSTTKNHEGGLIVMQQPIGAVDSREISRFHLISCEAFSYWKARGYLAAMCAALWRRRICILGREMRFSEIELLASGESLLGWQGRGIDAIGKRVGRYPEDMALLPKEYLRGVDPERNMFGHRAGLQMWLDLEAQGAMRTGVEKGGERAAFQAALDALNA